MKLLKTHIKTYEFIGKTVKIVKSNNAAQIGLEGKIIDETQNTFIIEPNKKVLKKEIVLRMEIDQKNIEIDGKIVIGRPYDRIKKVMK